MSARLRPPGNRPGERRLTALGPSRSCSIVSNASADLRHRGTPETLLVTDLVRNHTSPDTKTTRKLSLRVVDLRLYR